MTVARDGGDGMRAGAANRQCREKLKVCRRLLLVLGTVVSVCVAEAVRADRCVVCGAQSWVIGERFGPCIEQRWCGPVDSS